MCETTRKRIIFQTRAAAGVYGKRKNVYTPGRASWGICKEKKKNTEENVTAGVYVRKIGEIPSGMWLLGYR